ncbi:hypothetical protein CFC21_054456 [Triticum aestivum]|uniref:mannan endo-1,4-beta-mannosidase n=2 Tax=Triticum aestivum TaxID=4565 RepID=A0A3B6I381_WHEAT|nr:mannan endo-1,4-beta-mannosidase 3-like [Triticum aestivum]KAF7045344.1 hypothetical protein CFC21_054456 [Triticum aestivum]
MRPRPPADLVVGLFLLAVLVVVPWHAAAAGGDGGGMVRTDGTRFVAGDGDRTVYLSGFNAYWLMEMASDPSRRGGVVSAFRQAAAHGLNLARTWAFSDGGDRPLQSSPSVYHEDMFQGLDFVVAEARRHGIYLLLCLTNNFDDFGGKRQYVQWAREDVAAGAGAHNLTSADDFFDNTLVKSYYKNHVKTVLTRVNTVSGVAYRDDPAIFGWELMNEPRCGADPTGAMVQAWVEEMAPYLKAIDAAHLVTAGLEGFYGDGAHESKELNPWGIYYGTNFVATHQAAGIDFATIHLYPDVWLWGSTADQQARFFRNWTASHVSDTHRHLRKPLLVTEYGKFLWEEGGENATSATQRRDRFLGTVLDAIYESASRGGPLVGGAFWQLLLDGDGMDALKDGYQIVLPEDARAASIISDHSEKMAELSEQDAAESGRRTTRKIGSFVSWDGTHPYVQRFLIRFVSLLRSVSSLFGPM